MTLPPISWRMDVTVLTLSVLAAGDASNFFASACPSYFTTRTFRSKGGPQAENTKRDLRIGMVVGGSMSLAVGGAVTVVAKSWWPLVFTAAGCAIMVGMYEHALANPHGVYDSIAEQDK